MENLALSEKALLMSELLSGFPEASIDVENPTIFTLTIPLKRHPYGCILWMKRETEKWLEKLGKTSGTTPVKLTIAKNKATLQYFFVITFLIHRSIRKEYFHEVTGQMICSQIKRMLAKQIYKRFPLPFSLAKPLYAKDFPDTFIITPCTNDPQALARAEEKLFSAETFSALGMWLKECDISLICLKKINRGIGGDCVAFVIKRKVNCDERTRRLFCKSIEEKLRELGLDHGYAFNRSEPLPSFNFYSALIDRDLFFLNREKYDELYPRKNR